jgi:CubicO group peptidase (beta-lactamase class C family)
MRSELYDSRPRREFSRRAALFLALLFAAARARAASPSAGRDAESIEASRRLIEKWMHETGAPAALVTVSRGGRTIWSEAFGCASLELQVPASPRTRFRIGSVSKPLTSTAMALLVEDGKLDLDAPVQRYVPDFPVKAWPITTRQVAGHLSGIRHYVAGEFENQRHFDTVRAGLAMFEKDALIFEPGSKYGYSSHGYNLLSAVLEGASGERYLDLMDRRVFGPAGMKETAADDPFRIVPNRAAFYTREDASGDVRNVLWVDNSYKWASGGFVSTTEDLVRFANVLAAGQLVKPETLRLLWTSLETRDGKETGYGLGWSVAPDEKGRQRVWHSGGAQGGTAYLLLYPDEGLVVAMLVNSDESFTGRTPRIAEIFLDGPEAARVWRHRGAGFALAIPEVWEERYSVELLERGDAGAVRPKARWVVRFGYIPQNRRRERATLLEIDVFDRADWDAIRPQGGASATVVVGERAGRVWAAEPPAANPYPPESADARAFDEMSRALRVGGAFRLID